MSRAWLVLCLAVGCLMNAHASAATWSDLWSTREQQAQHLLDSNRPADAARMFSDPRRRAYAELQAGRYAEAAKLLSSYKDVDSQYNRGNALAHAGRLEEALAAYDAALAYAPDNRDVKHNRDLVARALEQQTRRDQQQGGGKGGGKGSGGNQGQGNQSQGNQSQGSQSQGSQSRDGQEQGSQAQASGAQGNQSAGAQPQDSNPAQGGARPGAAGAQTPGSGQGSGDNPEQAKRDAAYAAAHPSDQQSSAGSTGATARAGQASSKRPIGQGADVLTPRPKSEQTLALDQWLRRIPDDPGGLLRRKFLIEHMMKQQGDQP